MESVDKCWNCWACLLQTESYRSFLFIDSCNSNGFSNSRVRAVSWLDASTLGWSVFPTEAHSARPEVPAFTGVHDEHFIANVARNLPILHSRSANKQRLSSELGKPGLALYTYHLLPELVYLRMFSILLITWRSRSQIMIKAFVFSQVYARIKFIWISIFGNSTHAIFIKSDPWINYICPALVVSEKEVALTKDSRL